MATSRHTIEINGQLYDTVTGAVVGGKKPTAQVMDGFMKPKATVALQPQSTPVNPVKKQRVSIQDPKPAPKPLKRSKTLMRTAVKKPTATTTQPAKPAIQPTRRMPAHRLHHAKTTNKSELISKFGAHRRPALSAQVASVPVKAHPVPAAPPALDLRQQIAAVTGTATGAKQLFERALHQADSHKQPKIAKTKRLRVPSRKVGTMSGLAAAVLLAGFFFYQNMPQLSMRVAAARAGMSAHLPGYRPAGFALSSRIQYAPGTITVNYHSTSDDRAFSLTQQKTNLTPQTLVDELSDGTDAPYHVYQEAGQLIYIYDGSNAAWVDEGVLYKIEGQSALTSDQLIRLATSI